MGVTISHSVLAPISLASIIIGFISFAFTVGTFLKVFWESIVTLKAAPSEITDYLSNLKQALLEERRHLRKVRKRMKQEDFGPWSGGGNNKKGRRERRERRASESGHGYSGGKGPSTYFERDEQAFRSQGESEALRTMRHAIRDLIRGFRQLEYPFLQPEFQHLDSAHWSTNTPNTEKDARYLQSPQRPPYQDDDDDDGSVALGRSNRFGNEYRKCGLRERWLWLRRKGDVITMSESLSRIEIRRTAHEVGAVAKTIADIGRDIEDMSESIRQMESRLNRVVGVRRVG